MPPVANPIWLSKMRRACVFPLPQAYSRVVIGVFAKADYNAAETRQEAVEIGKRLHKDLRLFEHVSRKYEFKDADLYYAFLNYDTLEYVFKSYRPWFKRLFHLLGFENKSVSDAEAHWEMPFATGLDHPRFTIKESLVIRSKESRNLLQSMQAAEEMEDEDDLGVSAYDRKFVATMQMDNLVGVSDRSRSTPASPSRESTVSSGRLVDIEVELAGEDSDDENLGEFFEEGPELEIKVLPKPPSQDINFVKKK